MVKNFDLIVEKFFSNRSPNAFVNVVSKTLDSEQAKRVEQQIQNQMAVLKTKHDRKLMIRKVKYKLVLFLQSIRVGGFNIVNRMLPSFLAKRVIIFARAILGAVKPILRRLLLH